MTGAKYSVTRCSFRLLAASLAGTLREPFVYLKVISTCVFRVARLTTG